MRTTKNIMATGDGKVSIESSHTTLDIASQSSACTAVWTHQPAADRSSGTPQACGRADRLPATPLSDERHVLLYGRSTLAAARMPASVDGGV